jgi:CubicO group peptidase (beta-lactamase class C family)
MLNKKLVLLLPAMVCCLLACTQNSNVYFNKIETVLKEAEAKDVFAGAVLIMKEGKPFYEKTIGFADEESKIANTAGTKFSLGSITKLFTKTLILQLAEEKKINLTDRIENYLPGFTDPLAAQITIEQLAEHTSGFGDYAFNNEWEEAGETINSIKELLAYIQKQKLLFAPGNGLQYSNSGYAVLAALIEKICEKPLAEVYRERIFRKLKMDNSQFAYFNEKESGKATGYLTNFAGPKRNNLRFKMIGAGDGGIYSTTGDMWKFASSIMNDTLLLTNESKLKLFNSPLFPVHYTNWNECKTKGKLAVAGGGPGISAVLGINMEQNYCLVVLSNYDEGSAETIAQRLSAILNNKEVLPLNPPPSKFIYSLIKEKGPQHFTANYQTEFEKAGIKLEDDMILLSAGQALLQEKNADAALALYTVYTKEFPNIIIAWNDMGDAYLLKGDKANAKKCFEQALKLRPNNERALKMLKELE